MFLESLWSNLVDPCSVVLPVRIGAHFPLLVFDSFIDPLFTCGFLPIYDLGLFFSGSLMFLITGPTVSFPPWYPSINFLPYRGLIGVLISVLLEPFGYYYWLCKFINSDILVGLNDASPKPYFFAFEAFVVPPTLLFPYLFFNFFPYSPINASLSYSLEFMPLPLPLPPLSRFSTR